MPRCLKCGHAGKLGAPCPEHPDRFLVYDSVPDKAVRSALMGRRVANRYITLRSIGEGGMGEVYEAFNETTAQYVALKVLKADAADDSQVRERFLREARAMGSLHHPNLITLNDSGELSPSSKQLYIAMELLEGKSLKQLLRNIDLLRAPRLLQIIRGIAAGLGEAHRNAIVHRDLKPGNILVVYDEMRQEVPKVLDFGIARLSNATTVLTRTGMIFGTPAYMSPEQAAGETGIGPAADIYALGVILFQCLTGRRPFVGERAMQVMMAHMNEAPPRIILRDNLAVPRSLIDLTYQCLSKNPDDRPADGSALAQRLSRVTVELQHGDDLISGIAPPPSTPDEDLFEDTIAPGLDAKTLDDLPSVMAPASTDDLDETIAPTDDFLDSTPPAPAAPIVAATLPPPPKEPSNPLSTPLSAPTTPLREVPLEGPDQRMIIAGIIAALILITALWIVLG